MAKWLSCVTLKCIPENGTWEGGVQ